MKKTKPTLYDILKNKLEKEISKWKELNVGYNPLDLVQQVNYTSLFLRTLGSDLEQQYKKPFGKTTNDLH
jgi:hypothetical protein